MRWHRIVPLLLVCIAMAMTACDGAEDLEGAEPPGDGGDDLADASDSADAPSTEDEASDEPEPSEPSDDHADTEGDAGSEGSENATDPDAVEFPVEGPLTEAEAQAVLHEIDRLDHESVIAFQGSRPEVSDEVVDAVRAAYVEPIASVKLQSFHDIAEGQSAADFVDAPAPQQSDLLKIVEQEEACVHVAVELRREGYLKHVSGLSNSFFLLVPSEVDELNPTGWRAASEYSEDDGEPRPNMCEALAEFREQQ